MKTCLATAWLAFLLLPVAALAGSPFDGVWKTGAVMVDVPAPPVTYLLANGVFHCVGCAGIPAIPADGVPHAYGAAPGVVDSVKVEVIDDHEVRNTGTRRGRPVVSRTMTVSPDGRTMEVDAWVAPVHRGAPSVTRRTLLTRLAWGPLGSHPVSGTWRASRVLGLSDDLALSRFKVSGDKVDWSTPAGVSYHATFGGPPVPQIGDPNHVMITVRKVNDNQIVESDWRDGRITHVYTMTVSPDGRTMTMVERNANSGSVQTLTARKLSP
jgi:hypothetical protein